MCLTVVEMSVGKVLAIFPKGIYKGHFTSVNRVGCYRGEAQTGDFKWIKFFKQFLFKSLQLYSSDKI